ncbi:MAG: S-adenosylhomocysteine hydrolase [Rhodobacteraceae bacterium]|nr:MAG: S-adenosylhomocysteine hydrolase [Paracoccaceae bacterium]
MKVLERPTAVATNPEPDGRDPRSPIRSAFLERLVDEIGFGRDDAHRCVMIAHLFDDTFRMLAALEPLTVWDAVIGIPYSSRRPGVEAKWRARFGDRLHLPEDLGALEETVVAALSRSMTVCASRGQKLIVQDVGGFAAPILQTYFADRLHLVEGVVEITKQGVWRAEALPLGFPVVHCADSELKRLEAVRCGETVARCLDGVARRRGVTLAGRSALVMGAGWIGAAVARHLRRLDMTPTLIDVDPLKVMEARLAGFAASTSLRDHARAELVVGATGRLSITRALMETLPDGAMVASASSRQIEIDVDWLRSRSTTRVDEGVELCRIDDGAAPPRRLLLINGGFPANFLPGSESVADEMVECILGELIVLQQDLASGRFRPGLHRIRPDQETAVAQLWINQRDAPFAPCGDAKSVSV